MATPGEHNSTAKVQYNRLALRAYRRESGFLHAVCLTLVQYERGSTRWRWTPPTCHVGSRQRRTRPYANLTSIQKELMHEELTYCISKHIPTRRLQLAIKRRRGHRKQSRSLLLENTHPSCLTAWMRQYVPYIPGVGYVRDNWKAYLYTASIEFMSSIQSPAIHSDTTESSRSNPLTASI